MYNVLDKLKNENISEKYVIAILVCSDVLLNITRINI